MKCIYAYYVWLQFIYFILFCILGLLKSGKTNSVESLPELLTSDSEGSYAGVGSPRDLQSPDFTAGFHPEKVEVGLIQHSLLTTCLDVPLVLPQFS